MMMTAQEFLAARERLGWTREHVAAEFDLTPAVVEAWERGTVKIPRDIGRDLRWRVAVEEQQAVLAASGLPECDEAAKFDRIVESKDADAIIAASDAYIAHVDVCPVCVARREYALRFGPAMPEFPMPRGARLVAWGAALVDRLPRLLRPPSGPAGQGRWMGLWFGACFSALAVGIALLFSVSVLTRGGAANWWRDVVTPILVVIPGYFIGFYLAGAAYDALRPIGHRFVGYVLRWSLGGAAVYGTIAVLMPLIEHKPYSLRDAPGFVGLLTGFWAIIGAVLWVKDRVTGKLPKQAT